MYIVKMYNLHSHRRKKTKDHRFSIESNDDECFIEFVSIDGIRLEKLCARVGRGNFDRDVIVESELSDIVGER